MNRRYFLTTVGAGLFAGCSGSDAETQTTTQEETETTTGTAETTVEVGERVDDEKVSMVVRDMRRTETLGEFTKTDSGNTFVVIEFAVKNTTEREFLDVDDFVRTGLEYDSGYTRDQSPARTDLTFAGGQLVPGEVVRDTLAYEVPEDATGLALHFNFESVSFLRLDRMTVDLESTARPVADVIQTLRTDLHDLGESVSNGGVTVTVHGVEFTEKIEEFPASSEGHEYVVVDFTAKNGTGRSRLVGITLQLLVKDGRGWLYILGDGPTLALDQSYHQVPKLAAGEKRRGKVAYEVPKRTSPLYWTFGFNLGTEGNKTFWKLR